MSDAFLYFVLIFRRRRNVAVASQVSSDLLHNSQCTSSKDEEEKENGVCVAVYLSKFLFLATNRERRNGKKEKKGCDAIFLRGEKTHGMRSSERRECVWVKNERTQLS